MLPASVQHNLHKYAHTYWKKLIKEACFNVYVMKLRKLIECTVYLELQEKLLSRWVIEEHLLIGAISHLLWKQGTGNDRNISQYFNISCSFDLCCSLPEDSTLQFKVRWLISTNKLIFYVFFVYTSFLDELNLKFVSWVCLFFSTFLCLFNFLLYHKKSDFEMGNAHTIPPLLWKTVFA